MKTPTWLRYATLVLSASLVPASAAHAQSCQEIHFKRGHTSGTVRGVAPPEDAVCYTFATGAGQRASVEVKGQNVMFSVVGLVDARDRYSFTTEKKTYQIDVVQLMRSVTDEPFSLTVSVR